MLHKVTKTTRSEACAIIAAHVRERVQVPRLSESISTWPSTSSLPFLYIHSPPPSSTSTVRHGVGGWMRCPARSAPPSSTTTTRHLLYCGCRSRALACQAGEIAKGDFRDIKMQLQEQQRDAGHPQRFHVQSVLTLMKVGMLAAVHAFCSG